MYPGTDDTDGADGAPGPRRDGDADGTKPLDHAARLKRYDAIQFSADHTVIYDVENERAWVQSEAALDLEAIA